MFNGAEIECLGMDRLKRHQTAAGLGKTAAQPATTAWSGMCAGRYRSELVGDVVV